MHYQVSVHQRGTGWKVEVFAGPTKLFERQLLRAGQGSNAFPVPPESEAAQILASTPYGGYAALCRPIDNNDHAKLLDSLLEHEGGENSVLTFGRYLFETLLSSAVWHSLVMQSTDGQVKLNLCWPAEDEVLNRLPWETMHAGEPAALPPGFQGFLATSPRVMITRRVLGVGAVPPALVSPPHVLFVIGADIWKDVIRPGMEYMGLVRSLREHESGLSLQTRVLLNANTSRLETAVRQFKPQVVHFICHGEVTSNGPGLWMFSNDKDDKNPVHVGAEILCEALRTADNLPLPPVAVLNACSTAASDEVNVGRSLAARLVQMGVPVVVGMAGRVSDQACRMFTRGFYEALLKDGDVAYAAARGRRASIVQNQLECNKDVDWALPVLFLSEAMLGTRLTIVDNPLENDRQRAAKEFTWHNFPAFCDRLDMLQRYDQLMIGKGSIVNMPDWDSSVQVLALADQSSDDQQGIDSRARYGRTWLLEELAAQALRDGHVPVLVSKNRVGRLEYSKDLKAYLLDMVYHCIINTIGVLRMIQRHASLSWNWKYLDRLFALGPNDKLPDDFPQSIPFQVGSPADPQTVAAVMCEEWRELLEKVRAQCPERERENIRLLLLFDDLHRIDMAGDVLELFGIFGTRQLADDVRVVFTYSLKQASGQTNSLIQIKQFLTRQGVRSFTIDKLHDPYPDQWNEDQRSRAQTIYKHYLLNWYSSDGGQSCPCPLVPAFPEKNENVIKLFRRLAIRVEGIPSRLESDPKDIIVFAKDLALLRDANDQDLLRRETSRERDLGLVT